ncbi:MAG TPA: TadE/TadG family type IV pilus assembly protein [Terriglobia bacterium]|nr:TadE/TadG family type IV pilus assembly protein [Terriglobia bacterium]
MMKLPSQTGKSFYSPPFRRVASPVGKRTQLIQAAASTEGAQLLEFALALPFLLVFLVGIIDFAGAYLLKQKEANAAREGARIAVSTNVTDITCTSTTPCSIQAAAQAVANYMTNAGVDSSCISPSSLTYTPYMTYSYTCTNGISLKIYREYGYTYTPSGGSPIAIFGTKVTVTYPYTWSFNKIIGLLIPGANLALPSRLTESAVMKNLGTG